MFAGNWSGTISQGIWGNVKVPLAIGPDGTSVKMTAGERPATVNGKTITWKSGLFNEIVWTLTPQGDGRTASVTSNSGLGVNGQAVFNRTDMPDLTASRTLTPTLSGGIPTAQPVPNKPGYVYDPFEPSVVLDVRGRATGNKMKAPSGKVYIIP